MANSDQVQQAQSIDPACVHECPDPQVQSSIRARHDGSRVHRTVKIDFDTDQQLQRLTGIVPVLSVHACHLACLRAGLAAIQSDPAKLMAYLTDHKVRVPSSREV